MVLTGLSNGDGEFGSTEPRVIQRDSAGEEGGFIRVLGIKRHHAEVGAALAGWLADHLPLVRNDNVISGEYVKVPCLRSEPGTLCAGHCMRTSCPDASRTNIWLKYCLSRVTVLPPAVCVCWMDGGAWSSDVAPGASASAPGVWCGPRLYPDPESTMNLFTAGASAARSATPLPSGRLSTSAWRCSSHI